MPLIPLEHDEQVLVVKYCDLKKIPIFAIPNGSNKSIATAKKFKAEGLRSGITDLMLPIASNGYHGLFIEIKRIKGGTVSKEQRYWIDLLNDNGYKALVCRGHKEAIIAIEDYLKEYGYETSKI